MRPVFCKDRTLMQELKDFIINLRPNLSDSGSNKHGIESLDFVKYCFKAGTEQTRFFVFVFQAV